MSEHLLPSCPRSSRRSRHDDFAFHLELFLCLAVEIARVVEAFFAGDKDNDGLLDVKEFTSFIRSRGSAGITSQQLSKRCVWERACHECGMLVAYGLRRVPDDSLPPGAGAAAGKAAAGDSEGGAGGAGGAGVPVVEDGAVVSSLRMNLEEHNKPARQRYHNTLGKALPVPARCEVSRWTMKDRREGITALRGVSKDHVQQAAKVTRRGCRGALETRP